ncbi:MAG: hypothetical protein JRM86_04125 [Nitrososphaerota archaeon]|nr:hypothetical protein [Nitrososphaerota archaeon]
MLPWPSGKRRAVSNTMFAVVVAMVVAGAAFSAYGAYTMGGAGAKTVTEVNLSRSVATASAGGPASATSTGSLPPGAVSIAEAMALLTTPLSGAIVTASNDSITFTSGSVDIAAFALMPENATCLTGMRPPSYAAGDVFVIGGLIDPTLYIPSGATVRFTVVNLDDDMYHDLVVSSVSPPYPYTMMQYMMWGGGGGYYRGGMMGGYGPGYQGFLYMMPVLSPADSSGGWAQSYSYALSMPGYGDLWYLCTYPGHAQGGMYGEIVTR